MRSLRRLLGLLLSLLVAASAWPAGAWAQAAPAKPKPADQPAPPKGGEADPKTAMELFREVGVLKTDAQGKIDDPVLASYLTADGKLTAVGRSLYGTLVARKREGPKAALEMAATMQPLLQKMRDAGPFNAQRAENVARLQSDMNKLFQAGASGTIEDSYRSGAQTEALMNGAMLTDASSGEYAQTITPRGIELRDAKGVALRVTESNKLLFSRDVQNLQRQMNADHFAGVPDIPESGLYNYQMFQYSLASLKQRQKDMDDAVHYDRMLALAELLNRQYRDDMWWTDKTLEADLIAAGKANGGYDCNGTPCNIYDIVERHLTLREKYVAQAGDAVARYERDMKRYERGEITETDYQSMGLTEAAASRLQNLVFVEQQLAAVRNYHEHADPTAPDSQAIFKALDNSGLPAELRRDYATQAKLLLNRLDKVKGVLLDVRQKLQNADYSGNMDLVSASLNSAQHELGEVSTDYTLLLQSISELVSGQDQLLPGANPINWLGKGGRWLMSKASSGYKGNMEAVGREHEALLQAARLITSGDWAGARQAVIAANPEAARFQAGGAAQITDAMRLTASLKAAQEHLTAVDRTNKIIDAGAHMLNWAIVTAVAMHPLGKGAAIFGESLSKRSNRMFKIAREMKEVARSQPGPSLGNFAVRSSVRTWGIVNRVFGEAFQHFGSRMITLSPSPEWAGAMPGGKSAVGRYLWNTKARMLSATVRQLVFTGFAGSMSGAYTAYGHLRDVALGPTKFMGVTISDGHSQFGSVWEALGLGFEGGAEWANSSFMPMINYVGMPSTIYEGSKLATAFDVLGTRGAVGTGSMIGKSVLGKKPLGDLMAKGGLLDAMAEKGGWRAPVAFLGGTVDGFAKYMLFSQAIGGLGHAYARLTTGPTGKPLVNDIGDYDTDTERSIKRANLAEQSWADSYAWMLLPTFAAHRLANAAPAMMEQEIRKQYANQRISVINSPEVDLARNKVPLSQRLFDFTFRGEPAPNKGLVTEPLRADFVLEHINDNLERGGKSGDKVGQLQKALALGEGEQFLGMNMTPVVREQVYKAYIEAINAKPVEQTEAFLKAEPYEHVDGYEPPTATTQRSVAQGLLQLHGTGAVEVRPRLLAAAEAYLKDELAADGTLAPHEDLYKKVVKLPAKSPRLDAFKKVEIVERLQAWEKNGMTEGTGVTQAQISEQIRDAANHARAEGRLSNEEAEAVLAAFKGISSFDERFQAFNKVEFVEKRGQRILKGARRQLEAGKREKALEVLGRLEEKLGRMAKEHPGEAADGATEATKHLSAFARESEALIKQELAGAENQADAKLLREALLDIRNSAYVVRTQKGDGVSGWRDQQFVRMWAFYDVILEQSRGGGNPRALVLAPTSVGKTLIEGEGMLPFALAMAKATGRKVVILTTNPNLKSQLVFDLMAFNKLKLDIEFMTYSELKGKMAEGNLQGRDIASKYIILGDEFDASFLEAVLSIGGTTGLVTRLTAVADRIDAVGNRLLTAARSSGDAVESNARMQSDRLRFLADGLPRATIEPEAAAAVDRGVERTREAVERFRDAGTEAERDRARAQVAASAEALRDALKEPSVAKARGDAASFRQALDQLESSVDPMGHAVRKLKALEAPLAETGVSRDALGALGRARKSLESALRVRESAGERLDDARLARATLPDDASADAVSAARTEEKAAEKGYKRATKDVLAAAKEVDAAASRLSARQAAREATQLVRDELKAERLDPLPKTLHEGFKSQDILLANAVTAEGVERVRDAARADLAVRESLIRRLESSIAETRAGETPEAAEARKAALRERLERTRAAAERARALTGDPALLSAFALERQAAAVRHQGRSKGVETLGDLIREAATLEPDVAALKEQVMVPQRPDEPAWQRKDLQKRYDAASGRLEKLNARIEATGLGTRELRAEYRAAARRVLERERALQDAMADRDGRPNSAFLKLNETRAELAAKSEALSAKAAGPRPEGETYLQKLELKKRQARAAAELAEADAAIEATGFGTPELRAKYREEASRTLERRQRAARGEDEPPVERPARGFLAVDQRAEEAKALRAAVPPEAQAALDARVARAQTELRDAKSGAADVAARLDPGANPIRLERWAQDEQRMLDRLSPKERASVLEYRDLLDRLRELSSDEERATVRAALKTMEDQAGARPAEGSLASRYGRLDALDRQILSADRAADQLRVEREAKARAEAKALGRRAEPPPPDAAERAVLNRPEELRREREKTLGRARDEVRRAFRENAEAIERLAERRPPGWREALEELLSQRAELLKAYTGDKSPVYDVFQGMSDDAGSVADNAFIRGAGQLTHESASIVRTADRLEELSKAPDERVRYDAKTAAEFKAAAKRLEKWVNDAELSRADPGGADALLLDEAKGAVEEMKAVLARAPAEKFIDADGAVRALPEGASALGAARRAVARAEEILPTVDAAGFRAARLELKRIEGDPALKFGLVNTAKLLWRVFRGERVTDFEKGGLKMEQIGFTRLRAAQLLKALWEERLMPSSTRQMLTMKALSSLLNPRNSFVRDEIINMVHANFEDPETVRLDNKRGKFNVVFEGQWMETMDNPSRRWWQLRYGVDLDMPYSHQTEATMRGITTVDDAAYFGLTGTAGESSRQHLDKYGNKIAFTEGSGMPRNAAGQLEPVKIVPTASAADMATHLRRLARAALIDSASRVVLRASDLRNGLSDDVRLALEAEVARQGGFSKDGSVIFEMDGVTNPAAREWLQKLRETQPENTSLLVVSVAGTRMNRLVRQVLANQGIKPDEIANAFSDTEYLKAQVPEARVFDQMNLDGMRTGKVKVLILDSRVAGRGLDLNFKGDRNSMAADAFRGYTTYRMAVLEPQNMSAVHVIQSFGRIDVNRVLKNASREFSLVLSVSDAKGEPVFKTMFNEDPRFLELRSDPQLLDFARARGVPAPDWPVTHDFIASLPSSDPRVARYLDAVRAGLADSQKGVEENQLKASSVSDNKQGPRQRYQGFSIMQPTTGRQ